MATRTSELDPLKHGFEYTYSRAYHPLGFCLQLATNAEEVLAAAEASWGRFPPAFSTPPIEVRVAVEPGGARARAPEFRMQRHLLAIVSDAENYAVCDHTSGFAWCRLNAETARDRAFVSSSFLEAIAYHTLTQLYVTPLHAACVALDGCGVLLCGDSGAGKSTLAYACAQRGWTYISDNESWLLRGDGRTVLGNPWRIRLCSGDGKSVLATEGFATACSCRPERIVFLNRQRAAGMREISMEEAVERLFAWVIRYAPDVRQEQRAAVERLARVGAVEMGYGSVDEGIAQLEGLLCRR